MTEDERRGAVRAELAQALMLSCDAESRLEKAAAAAGEDTEQAGQLRQLKADLHQISLRMLGIDRT